MSKWKVMGTRANGTRLKRMKASRQWKDNRFVDSIPRHDAPVWSFIWRWLREAKLRVPKNPIPIHHPAKNAFATFPSSGLRITWLGHSTSLVEIDGYRLLLDPVWSDRSTPYPFKRMQRFHAPPLALKDVPKLDAVIISHDHYDHLDQVAVMHLASFGVPFFVPLGVGAHLEYWGIKEEQIIELDWWEEHTLGPLTFVATPARHFSGRSLVLADQDQTLWAGWAVLGPTHRVYFSGDTAMFPEFPEIGARLGPFDATLIEIGAYGQEWPDLHLGPEQAIQAHQVVQGGVLFPVHWGMFDLAFHGWTEPIERVLVAAKKAGVQVATPRPGESIEPKFVPASNHWWPPLPWKTAEEEPVVSTGLENKINP